MLRQPLIPPVISDLVYLAVTGVADVQFTEVIPCPDCGGFPVSHDMKRRRFSTVTSSTGTEHISVYVKRFHCRDCKRLCYAPAPFYEKSRFGSPVVDLCLTLTEDTNYSRAAEIMNQLGIHIDRGTVRKTVQMYDHEVSSTDLFGLRLPQSIISLSTLLAQYDTAKPLSGRDVLIACGFV